jgi:hypothetical protein
MQVDELGMRHIYQITVRRDASASKRCSPAVKPLAVHSVMWIRGFLLQQCG